MRSWVSRLLAVPVAIWATGTVFSQALPGWTLVWADEFSQADGTKPDSSKWGYDLGGSGWGNNEIQYYTDRVENARIESGNLVIEARAENLGGRNHTSARLLTRDKASWTYGRIEARIKVPRGQGIWPAFWMLGANIGTVNWPNCGEIDIMENIGREPSTLYGTVHGPGYSGANGISGNTVQQGAALADDFHVFAVEWEENRLRWFLDGQLFFTVTPASLPSGASWVFNQPQFLILNVAVGGNWPGYPDGTTVFPQRMTVDYVRVYSPAPVAPVATSLTVDPGESWLGYMNVSNLPASGGAYQFGNSWATADLHAAFSGTTLGLTPCSIADPDPYWYLGGGAPGRAGNKVMDANLYVEKTNSLAGKTVTFTGTVLSNTLTSSHQAYAFIKDFAPDYSSSNTVTAPLAPGPFSISLTTSAAAGRHVQYGFQTRGVNVWPGDLGNFGSVQITSATPDPFDAWMATFDFSAYASPDLSPDGDPDGDGQNNRAEFALDGDPGDPKPSPKMRVRTEPVGGELALILTLPVRDGAVFTGSAARSATVAPVGYRIEGSNNLADFDQAVAEITPARSGGLPAVTSGWNYRSFRLTGQIGGPTPRGPRGFLRASIFPAP